MQYPHVEALEEPAFAGPSRSMLALDPFRALLEVGSLGAALSLFRHAPKGDGHPVITAPGFMAGDGSMAILRCLLKRAGYAALPWGLGQNISFAEAQSLEKTLALRRDIVNQLVERLQQSYRETGQKISLIGWSLGGLMSRDAARQCPEAIRQVITLGTPFGDPRCVSVYELMARHKEAIPAIEEIQEWINLGTVPLEGVPMTVIYSKSDGFVAPGIAHHEHGDMIDNICLTSSHIGFPVNPLVLYVIADRLNQAEGEWVPFPRTLLRKLLYR